MMSSRNLYMTFLLIRFDVGVIELNFVLQWNETSGDNICTDCTVCHVIVCKGFRAERGRGRR